MIELFAKHLPYEDGHLGKVRNDMEAMGPPTIRVMKFKDKYYCALEGSHRIAVAHFLNLIPKLVIEVQDTDTIPNDHWEMVLDDLPLYNFEHAMILDLRSFLDDSERTNRKTKRV